MSKTDTPRRQASSSSTDRASESRAERFAARHFLWDASHNERRRRCGRVQIVKGGGVPVMLSGGRASYAGLETCGSVWSCPVCQSRIAAERSNQISAALRHHLAQPGGTSAAMLTLTMRHNDRQSLAELWDHLSDAWRASVRGKEWDRDRDRWGVLGSTRIVEVTHGENGWHLHIHALLFFSATPEAAELQALGERVFGRWATRLTNRGMAAPIMTSGGLDVRPIYAAKDAALYLAKVDGTSGVAPDAAALEMAHSQTKTLGGRSQWQLLGAARAGDAEALKLWHEWEKASKGRRFLIWSQGKGKAWRAILNARGLVRSDEEIAADDSPEALIVGFIPRTSWRSLTWSDRRALARILTACERAEDSFAALTGCLLELGLAPPDRPPASLAA